jgi:hypothetical protein
MGKVTGENWLNCKTGTDHSINDYNCNTGVVQQTTE